LKLSQAQETLQGISRKAARDIEATSRMVLPIIAPHLRAHAALESSILSFQAGSLIPQDRVKVPEG